jgi:diguanylate cyclase (GGDEF)-like protein
MIRSFIEVLLIEDNPVYSRMVRELMAASGSSVRYPPFRLTTAGRLTDGLALLARRTFNVVLLDLSLPDSDGLGTFDAVSAAAPNVPVVVLTGISDEEVAASAMQAGAQDYIVKGELHHHPLLHSIWYAIERQRLLLELRAQSLEDPLTGLYNRRGFFLLAEQQLRLAARTRHGMLLLFADLDDLKLINDSGGHAAGDQALQAVAAALRKTFRDSDILGRLGGDEFAVLAIGAPDDSAAGGIAERLQHNLAVEARAALRAQSQPLSLSLGVAHYEPDHGDSIEALVAKADAAMYRGKGPKDAYTSGMADHE